MLLSSFLRPCSRLGLQKTMAGTASSAPMSSLSSSSPSSSSSSSSSLANASTRERRSRLFSEEKKRQIQAIPRVQKMTVKYFGPNIYTGNNKQILESPDDDFEQDVEEATLVLNQGLSTPYDAAQHLSEMLMDRSALAMVNGQLWDMHRPIGSEVLEDRPSADDADVQLELLHFHQEDPFHVNRAFWRSCSFLLGSVLEEVFKDDYFVELHSFPPPNVASGCFIHDVDLKMSDWNPTKQELMVFSAAMHRLAEKALPFERLDVSEELAKELFKDNQYKINQIPSIVENSKGGSRNVTVYRVGDHVDMSRGPMVGNTSFLGRRCTIAAAHPIERDGRPMYRFQGVALPRGIFLNHFAFGILEKRAMKLNESLLSSSSPPQL